MESPRPASPQFRKKIYQILFKQLTILHASDGLAIAEVGVDVNDI